MKIVEVVNAFFVLDKIQSVIMQPVTATSKAMFKNTTEKDNSGRWFIQIAYHNQGAFKTYFDDEEKATESYNRIMNSVKDAEWS